MAIDLAELGLRVRSDGFVTADQRMSRFNKTAARTDKAAASNNEMFARLARTVGSLVAAYAGLHTVQSAINNVREFETALVGVSKTTGLVGNDLESFSASIDELSRRIPVTANELLGMAQAAGQMGVTGVENLEKFSVTVAKLGRASDISGEQAATALARILNVTGENISEIDTLASVIVSLGNSIEASESEIANMTTRISQSTAAFGISSAEATALGAAMRSLGAQAEAGGTAAGQAFSAIANAVNAGGSELREFADALDLNGDMLARLFQDDKIAGFQYFLEQVGQFGDDAGLALEKAGLGGVRLSQAIVPLSRNTEIFEETLRLANAEVENATALNDEAAAAFDTFDSRLTTAQGIVSSFSRALGEDLVGSLDETLKSFNEFMGDTENFESVLERVSEGFDFASKAAGALALVYLTRLIPATSTAITLTEAWAVLAGGPVVRSMFAARGAILAKEAAVRALNRALTFLASPTGIAIVAIAVAWRLVESQKAEAEAMDETVRSINNKIDSLNTLNKAQLENQQEAQQALVENMRTQIAAMEEEQRMWQATAAATDFAADKARELSQEIDALNIRLNAENAILGSLERRIANKAGLYRDLFETVGEVDQALGRMAESSGAVTESTVSNAQAAARYEAIMNNMGRLTYPQYLKSQANVIEQNEEMIEQIKNTIDPTRELEETVADLWEQFEEGALGDITAGQLQDYIDQISEVETGFNNVGSAVDEFAGSMMNTIGIMRGMTEEGTKSYKALTVAMQAMNVVQAVNAVLNQATGDPYSAFGRMAAMAAAVASLGVSVGSISGGVSDPTEARQASQGTGTVLGDTSAQSESIANAIESIEETNSEIVNINRGMLRALQTVQQGIAGATARLIQDTSGMTVTPPAGGDAFSGIHGAARDISSFPLRGLSEVDSIMEDLTGFSVEGFLDDIHEGVVETLFGGDVDQIDEGIRILGGRLESVINNGIIEAFAEFEIDGGWFGSDEMKQETEALSQEAQSQFRLVFDSIADTVREGGAALGIPAEEIERRVNDFNVAMQTMSFEGMDADERIDALEAYFSTVFDQLANQAIPFLDELQRAGEGLGETMARTASQVQVFREAANTLGFAIQQVGTANVARAADNISQIMGGVENFAQGITEFEDTFLSEEEQFTIGARRLREAMGDLDLPETRDQFTELVQAQNAYTESGQRNIATLLNLQGQADEYYDYLEERAQLAAQVDQMFGGLSETIRTSLMSQEELYNYQRDRVHDLTELMNELTDPEAIERTAAQIERTVSNMWSSLDETQQKTLGEDFLGYVDDIESLTQDRIEESLRRLDRGREGIESVIANDMQPAADAQVDAARRQQSAASEMMNAAQMMSQAMNSRGNAEVNG